MQALRRKLLAGMLLSLTLAYALGTSRFWHAHSSADMEHDHAAMTSHTARHSHDHRHGHSHPHHAHGHSHSHGHAHPHKHPHPHARPGRTSSESPPESASVRSDSRQWHLHVSILGWSFTIWGSEAPVRSQATVSQVSTTDHKVNHPANHSNSRHDAEAVGTTTDGTTIVSSDDSDWLTNWDSSLLLLPLLRSALDLPFDPGGQFSNVDNEWPGDHNLQPPVPPPRVTR